MGVGRLEGKAMNMYDEYVSYRRMKFLENDFKKKIQTR